MNNRSWWWLMVVGSIMVAGEAVADGARALHGGQLQKGGKHYYEMVVHEVDPALRTQEVVLYVYDLQGKPKRTQQVTARAVAVSGREKVSIDLPSIGDNRLAGSAMFKPQPDTRLLVTTSWSDDQFPEQVKFTMGTGKATGK
ncbi:MAG: hypothetical protein HQL58_05105 [Magnetococcales bacterium]|nr:hypothetical protein [Magnetococcales bacterium]